MLSATKNFVLTFIIALIIFGLIAYMLVGLVLNNLLGTGEETAPPEETTTEPDAGPEGPIGIQYADTGESFNILLIGTDYRPSDFVNYDPAMLELLYGIKADEVTPSSPPSDVKPKPGSVVSDKDHWSADGIVAEDGSLVFGGGFYSVDYRLIETDSLVLIRADKEREQFTFTVFPTDAYVDMSGKYVKLSEVYGRYGLQTLLNKVYAMTGVMIDNYAVISVEQFPALVDALGGISFNVPCDMNYVDRAGGIEINLNAGLQRLDGDGVLDVLMFRDYQNGGSRERTTAELIKKFITTFISITNYNRAPAVFAELEAMIDTDFTIDEFKKNIDVIFKYAYNNRELYVTTAKVSVGSEELTVVDEPATCDTFSNYKRIYN